MNLLKKGTPTSKWTRLAAWLLVGITVLWASDIVDKYKTHRDALKKITQLSTSVQKIWMQETSKVDEINKRAALYAKKKNLKPGDPLPPSFLYEKNNPFWENFDKSGKTQILRNYLVKNENLQAGAITLIAVGNTVPQEGEPYAATCIIADPKLVDNAHQIHPPKPLTRKALSIGFKEIEEKQKKVETETPSTPNP